MPNDLRRTVAAIGAAVAVLAVPAVVQTASAHASPLPEFCAGSNVADDVCTTRLTSVTADVVNGTITGEPIGGGAAITLSGQVDAYQKSAGFGAVPPEPVQQWDTSIDEVSGLDVEPSDPNWYGNAKARVFLPRSLNDLATRFPLDVLLVRFTPDDTRAGTYRIVSIQPTAQ